LGQLAEHSGVYSPDDCSKNGGVPKPSGEMVFMLDLAIRLKSTIGLVGTQAWIVVPTFGVDWTTNVPFSDLIRSCILVRPRPSSVNTALTSKPTPKSLTVRLTCCLDPRSRTWTLVTPVCFTALVRHSCRTRKRPRAISGARRLGTSSLLNAMLFHTDHRPLCRNPAWFAETLGIAALMGVTHARRSGRHLSLQRFPP